METLQEFKFDCIRINTPPPGPKSLARQQKISSLSTPFCGSFPFVFHNDGLGQGPYVASIDDNVFLDFNSQICSNPLGYNHPDMIDALKPYLNRFPLKVAGDDFFLKEREVFQETLMANVPDYLHKLFIINSGAEAIENAIKTAFGKTKRSYGVSLQGAFHGRTLGALTLTNSNIRHKEFYPSFPVRRIPFVEVTASDNELEESMNYVQNLLHQDVSPNEIAFIIFEPIQGEGGYRVPHSKYIKFLRQITKEYGIYLIADEVQSGMGRTGKMWAHEHFDIDIDLMTAGKALQVAATIGNKDKFFSDESDACRISSTWGGGDIIGLVMGTAVLNIIQKENLLNNVNRQGEYLKNRLTELSSSTSENKNITISVPRGKGLMIGMEITSPGKNDAFEYKNKILRNTLVDKCYGQGLLILGAGWNNLRFAPPLNVESEHIDEALSVIEAVIKDIESE